jgi:hypothetical protein
VATLEILKCEERPTLSGLPGDSIDITGTLLNPDPDPIFLNSYSGLLTSLGLDFDPTDFFTIVPAVLNTGESYSGPIVSVLIDPAATPGDYFGSITLQGGADSNAFDDLATQNFQFTVSSGVPEPNSAVLLLSGFTLLGLGACVRTAAANRRAPGNSPAE